LIIFQFLVRKISITAEYRKQCYERGTVGLWYVQRFPKSPNSSMVPISSRLFLQEHKIKPKDGLVFDHFLGTGTTCLAAMSKGYDSVGIEAHDFVSIVASTKLSWTDYDINSMRDWLWKIGEKMSLTSVEKSSLKDLETIPELVKKCYSEDNLRNLLKIKHAIRVSVKDLLSKKLLNLALTATLRTASHAGTGWPYVAPTKHGSKKKEKSGVDEFQKHVTMMLNDIQEVRSQVSSPGEATVIEGDSRVKQDQIKKESVAITICSPPYLNNYDYADRTRLETYFFGHVTSWSEITKKYRSKLMTAATTQTKRTDVDPKKCLSDDFWSKAPELAKEITQYVIELSEVRLTKGGKKSYDVMTAEYFEHMLQIIEQVRDYSMPGAPFILVLGDSAPYGVHIKTETIIGELGKALGFSDYSIEELRTRGGKWADNPQRHSVPLRECITTLVR